MTLTAAPSPRFRPVAGHAVLVEFGERIDPAIHDRVIRLDAALAAATLPGIVEAVPAYASLLVAFDPIVTDHQIVEAALRRLSENAPAADRTKASRTVDVCYDDGLGLDLDEVARASGLSRDAVIATHLSGRYGVFMYGFAPGYAYLAGVPAPLQLPRKDVARRGVAAGSVIIAGPQCLVTTLTMPTGWWILGRSPTRILSDDPVRPFLFDVGDTVTFRRIDRAAFDALARSSP